MDVKYYIFLPKNYIKKPYFSTYLPIKLHNIDTKVHKLKIINQKKMNIIAIILCSYVANILSRARVKQTNSPSASYYIPLNFIVSSPLLLALSAPLSPSFACSPLALQATRPVIFRHTPISSACSAKGLQAEGE